MIPLGSDDILAHAIASWLPQARWFPSKSQSVPVVKILDRIPLPLARSCELVVVETLPADGGDAMPTRFFLPTCQSPAGPVDAAAMPEVARWLVETALVGRHVRGRGSSLVGIPVSASSASPSEASWRPAAQVAALAADSSNTLLTVRPEPAGGRSGLVLKLLRQVRPGIQPEVEIGRFLASDSQWHHTPRLRAALEWQQPTAEPAIVAVVHDEIPHAASLWPLLLADLTTVNRELSDAASHDPLRQRLMPTLVALGRVTARMHRALAAERGAPAFGSESWSAAASESAAAAMTAHATQVLDALAASPPALAGASAAMLQEVLGRRDHWLSRLAAFADGRWQSRRIRVHGDYHLGQVLFDRRAEDRPLEDRLMIIDFEGEPQRPLAERRCKQSAAKDVAGMLRSLDYLVRVAEREGSQRLPADTCERLTGWFLGSYTATAQGSRFWPSDPVEAHRLLELYCLDKAIYELAYEAGNRPDWIDVPLAALLELADDR